MGWLSTIPSASFMLIHQPMYRVSRPVLPLILLAMSHPSPGRVEPACASWSNRPLRLIPDTPPVTWIQVGPGKFVRLEGRGQATDPTETTLATVGANPDADVPLHVAAAATAPAETLAEQDPCTPPEISPGEVGLVLESDDCPGGSNTEEYGIAPSAFSVSSEVSPSVDSQAHVTEAVTEPEADPDSIVSQGERLSWRVMESGRLWSQQGTSRRRSGRVTRGMVPAIPALGRASRRCNLCTSPGTRSTAWFRFAPNVRRQQAACRAFGRITHIHRALRPRSPPLSSVSEHRAGSAGRDRLRSRGRFLAGRTSPVWRYPLATTQFHVPRLNSNSHPLSSQIFGVNFGHSQLPA